MLGKLTGQHQSDSGLNFSARKSCFLVVGSELSSFGGDAFENVINERVHDAHALFGDSSVRVDL